MVQPLKGLAAALGRLDPLLQFLGVGLLLFLFSLWIRPFGDDEATIRVDRPTLEQYLAAGGGEALSSIARSEDGVPSLDALNADQTRQLVDNYVEEQALYREASSWGLGEGDLVIRRRLGQSLRYALRPELAADPGDDVLREYYRANQANYRSPTEISFDHIFFSIDRRGADAAREDAARAISSSVRDWRAMGDRFPYQRNYVNAGPATIGAQLGDTFADRIATLPVKPETWQGPLRSSTGFHAVRILRRSEAQIAPFEEVRQIVLDDWQRQQQGEGLERAVAQIVRGYDTSIGSDIPIEAGPTR